MCRQHLLELGGTLQPLLTWKQLHQLYDILALPSPASDTAMLDFIGLRRDEAHRFCWTKIFNDKGAGIKTDRGRYQCGLSEQSAPRTIEENELFELLLDIHEHSLSHLGHAWDHSLLMSSTQSPYATATKEMKPRMVVHAQKRHRDIWPELALHDGTLVAPGAHIVLLAVMADTALDVWIPSEQCMMRIPIPIGHGLVLPADTVHRGIELGTAGTDSNQQPSLCMHFRIHWYVCRHELTIPDGKLNSQTDWELVGMNIPMKPKLVHYEW